LNREPLNPELIWTILRDFKIFIAIGTLAFLATLLLALRRMSGMLNWRRSLQQELKNFRKAAEKAAGARGMAMMRVVEACEEIRRTTHPGPDRLADIRRFVHDVAACYYPEAEVPELCISIAGALTVLRASADHLERILQRPGFRRLQWVRIRHINKALAWYERLSRKWIVRRIQRSRNFIRRIYHGYLAVWPDPFALLVFFSNRLILLQLTRYLVLDVYLFAGRLAVAAYDTAEGGASDYLPSQVEQTLEALQEIENVEYGPSDPEIRRIRNRLVGIGAFLLATPGLKGWQAAVRESAQIIARRYFPDAEQPLAEAALGPLLQRAQEWLRKLSDIERTPGVKQFYRIRLDRLYTMKSVGDAIGAERLWEVAKKALRAYRWMRWPLKGYRFLKRTAPLKIASATGFILIRRGVLNFILRSAFDSACRELELVYRKSRRTEPELVHPEDPSQ